MKRNVIRIIRNPLFVLPPFVFILLFCWQQYTYAGRQLSLPNAQTNIMPNSQFSNLGANDIPAGWTIENSEDAAVTSGVAKGYTGSNAFTITVPQYRNGSVTVISPKVRVAADTTYLFKGYYNASMPFWLLAKYYYADDSSSTRYIQSYPGAGGSWSTLSDAFNTGTTVTSVQFICNLTAKGQLQLNSLYLQPDDQVFIATDLAGANNIPNGSLQPGTYAMPANWSSYHSGRGVASFAYAPQTGSVGVSLQNYQDGQAKWQYPPQPVTPHQYYIFQVTYQSDVTIPIVAEYESADGSRQYQTVATLQPSSQPTVFTHGIEVPSSAINMFVSLPLQRNGTLTTSNYSLINTTRPGAEWKHPMVSLTFDDGWQSAYTNAAPLLKHFGYSATFYINSATIETGGFMTAQQLRNLADSNHEIASHGYDHDDMTAIHTAALRYQLQQGRNYLRRAGFAVGSLAPPYGRSDPQVQWFARRQYTTVRGSENGINTRQNLDPYNLKILYITETTSLETIRTALQATRSQNGWLILVYHRIDANHANITPKAETTTITTQTFSRQLQAIRSSAIPVTTIANAYKEITP